MASIERFQTKSKIRRDGSKITVKYGMHYIQGNNRPYFSITGETWRKARNGRWVDESGGCIHDEIARSFPELAELIPWHLCDQDGTPMHYPANAAYHAGDRDCWGLRKGEFKPIIDKKTGLPLWQLKTPEGFRLHSTVAAESRPDPITLEWEPYGTIGEGKAREFDHARSCAVWPNATDEELSADNLKDVLMERLPALQARFRETMARFGVQDITPEEMEGGR